jgi:fatty acid amide hydrolase 2
MRHLNNYHYMMVFNGLGLPVVNCPIGRTSKNMPVGFQVVANQGCDHLLISVARELQDAFGGWTPPPSYEDL